MTGLPVFKAARDFHQPIEAPGSSRLSQTCSGFRLPRIPQFICIKGVSLLRLYVELLDLLTARTSVLTPVAKTSPHQIPVVDVLLAWWYGLARGAARLEHRTRYRHDPLRHRLLELPRVPSPETVRRFFGRITYRHTTEVSEALMQLSLKSLRPTLLGHTLDLDSTVFCCEGEHTGRLIAHHL